jgi:glycine hydroxymethyltransferase
MQAPGTTIRYLDALGIDVAAAGVSPSTVAFAAALDAVGEACPEVASAIAAELVSQRESLKLIASENYASPAVLLAMGNWLSDKYAEGAPGHRFYAGCDVVDAIETRAAQLACSLFGAEHAYVQPHSGIDANLVAFWAILTTRVERPALERLGKDTLDALSDAEWEALRRELGDQRLLGMSLDAGGHLTHGFRPNISGKLFRHSSYGVDAATGLLDYDAIRAQALRERPLILLAGYSSYPRRVDFRAMREIADEAGAVLMVDMAHFAGLVAGGVFTGDHDPVRHAHVVTSTTHKTLRGPRGGLVLCVSEFAGAVDRGCPLVLGGPLPHVMAAKAVALAEASRPEFSAYAADVVANARALAGGLMAQGVDLVTSGTDNHLVMVDLRRYGVTGRQAESALRSVGITVNRNVLPNDPNGSWYTSGLRLGTPALTTRGLTRDDMEETAVIIADVLAHTRPDRGSNSASAPSRARFRLDEAVRVKSLARVAQLVGRYPLYPGVLAAPAGGSDSREMRP